MEIQKEILKICMKKGFLLDKEMLGSLSVLDEESAKKLIETLENLKIDERVITKSLFCKNFEKIRNVLIDGRNKTIIEKFFISLGYARTEINPGEGVLDEGALEKVETTGKIKLISSPAIPPKKVEVQDFVKYFRIRYDNMKKIFQDKNLENLSSIRKLGDRKDNYTIIVAIMEKRITKNKNIILTVEDMSGTARVIINKNKEDVFEKAKDLLVDDIVAMQVSGNSEWLFGNEIIFPDSYLSEKKKSNIDEWVVFTSDVHVGSKMFLEKNFLKFIKWINGNEGTEEQREIAKKVKYLFLAGDSIDGVGVFPDQEKVLAIKDIKDQYEKLCEYLRLIRKDIKIILSPGQHDGVRVAEPQPIVEEYYAPGLHKMENLSLVSNPAMVEIDGDFRVLIYHGAGFHGMVDEIEDIRLNYGHNSPARMVKEVLKRRHLSPMHGPTTYIPSDKEDPLMIVNVPDILLTGDWHRAEVGMYNNILTVAGSCWQSITPFEEKVGNHPDPCKVPLVNLKTREIKILDFSEEESFVAEGKESIGGEVLGGLREKTCEEDKGGVVCSVAPVVVGVLEDKK